MSTSTNHGDPSLACRAARWPDYLQFFLLNYAAHSATLKTPPGQSAAKTIIDIFTALFFPTAGVFRGFKAIQGSAILADTDLRIAARAGALCTVVPWPSAAADPRGRNKNLKNFPPSIWSLFETSVHGRSRLPRGYVLVTVPPDAEFENDHDDNKHKGFWWSVAAAFRPSKSKPVQISCSYNIIKILIAVIQLLYAVVTMYQSRGEQIKWYGYTAFGLTVAPYAWMSLVNLSANLMCPEYSSMYLVGSPATAQIQPGVDGHTDLDGVVGNLTPASYQAIMEGLKASVHTPGQSQQRKSSKLARHIKNWFRLVLLTILAAAIPLIIIGTLSHLRTGSHSRQLLQISITLWYLYGVYFGFVGHLLPQAFEDRPFVNIWACGFHAAMVRLLVVITLLIGGCIAGWGLYWVGMMLKEYGVCIQTN